MSNGYDDRQQIFRDEKKQSLILNMIEYDCTLLYDKFNYNKSRLRHSIELYEEFITTEINTLFEQSNTFVEIVLSHRTNFKEFMLDIDLDEIRLQNGHDSVTNQQFVIYITLQEWWLQGPKGQQFYLMVDIDVFRFHQNWGMNLITTEQKTSDNNNAVHVNGIDSHDKIARLKKYGAPAVTFIAFHNHQPTRCDADTTNAIRQVQDYLKNKNFTSIECIPNKCSYLLLPKLFYELNIFCENNQAHISINNRKYRFSGDGPTEMKAKNYAARRALKKLCYIEYAVRSVHHGSMSNFDQRFADGIEKMVTSFCNTIKAFANTKNNARNVIAGIVQTTNYDVDSAKVVVLASGTKGIDAECMYNSGTVHDSHAEVVARRSLMIYFYNQLKMLCDKNADTASKSIFIQQSMDAIRRYRLKNGIKFHLFTSRAPCGDATAFYCKDISERGKLRVKVEKKEDYMLVDKIKNDAQSAGAFHGGTELYTASCSDKIARWNVVGIQGALLSRIIEPIYLDSIIMSQNKLYNERDCLRAFYNRVENSLTQLPESYRHNKPKIAFASAEYKRNTHSWEAEPYSLNWIDGITNPLYEKILSKTGHVLFNQQSKESRISKIEFMKRFVDLMKLFPELAANSSFHKGQRYDQMKADAIDYNRAKYACIQAFQTKNLGNWKKVQKPAETDEFHL